MIAGFCAIGTKLDFSSLMEWTVVVGMLAELAIFC